MSVGDAPRVALVCGYFDPARDGVADYTGRLAQHLAAAGVDALVATTSVAAEAAGGAAGGRGGFPVIGVTDGWGPAGVARAANALGRLHVDVVHVQWAPSVFRFTRAVGLLPLLLRRRPLVVTLHEYGVERPAGAVLTAFRSSLERAGIADRETGLLVPRARRLLVPDSAQLRVVAARFPTRTSDVLEVPIGPNIDVAPVERDSIRRTVRECLGMAPDAPLVVFFGFLHPVKGLDRLVEAAGRLRRLLPGLRLVLAGGAESHSVSGPAAAALVAALRERANVAGAEVLLPGHLPAEQVSRLLSAADAAAFPFDAGMTVKSGSLLATLAHGVPTVATVGEAAGAAGAVDGILPIPPRDTDALTTALHRVLTDQTLASRLRTAGLARAARHDWSRIARVHAELYRQLS